MFPKQPDALVGLSRLQVIQGGVAAVIASLVTPKADGQVDRYTAAWLALTSAAFPKLLSEA